MPRLLESERLACAVECSWLGTVSVYAIEGMSSPIQVAARLVIEWSDFSEPWRPARMLRHVLKQMGLSVPVPAEPEGKGAAAPVPFELVGTESPAALEADPVAVADAAPIETPDATPKRRRVRVRVRRDHRRYRRQKRGPSILDILLSFGQWIRYSIRSWMLYR